MDFYRTYINPHASDRKTLQVSHLGVVGHGVFMAGFALMLNYAGATNNWSTYFRPIVACPGIFPLMLTLLWSKQTKLAAILAPILGLCSGMATWLALSWKWSGAINIQTTQIQLPGLYGGLVSFFTPAIYSVIISLWKPSTFDWRVFLQIDLVGDKSGANSRVQSCPTSTVAVDQTGLEIISGQEAEKKLPHMETGETSPPPTNKCTEKSDLDNVVHPFPPEMLAHIRWWLKFATAFLVINMLTTIVLWPLPLYRDWIFSKSFFNGWVSMAIVWQFFAICAVVIFPVWDGRQAIDKVFRGVVKTGRS